MTTTNFRRPPRPYLAEPVDELLIDLAIRIQLSRADYRKAEERYDALGKWIDRQASPLAGQVELVYPQGSMAIGATVASRLTTDEHDVDFVAQLALPRDTAPKIVLDLLFESIRGELGSLYHELAERRNRCVTVHYADKMHADITPMVRLHGQPERESYLFHSKPEDHAEADMTLVANPFGFAQWFKAATPADDEFVAVFEKRVDDYERLVLAAKTESDDLPDQEPVHRKSTAVIAHQLMKRWRNVQFDKREMRRPPSVMMAKLAANAAKSTETLSEELLHQSQSIRDQLISWHQAGRLIQVVNPICSADVFTDRWPGSLHEQFAFISDLEDLVAKVERLIAGCPLVEMKAIMTELFGEAPTGEAFKAFNDRTGEAIREGRSQHVPGPGRLVLPAGGIVTGTDAPAGARPTPKSTFFGTEPNKR